MMKTYLPTTELRTGDVVNVHGIAMTLSNYTERVGSHGLVVSFRGVPVDPIVCTCGAWGCSREWIAAWVRRDGYWNVQGNDKATWEVLSR